MCKKRLVEEADVPGGVTLPVRTMATNQSVSGRGQGVIRCKCETKCVKGGASAKDTKGHVEADATLGNCAGTRSTLLQLPKWQSFNLCAVLYRDCAENNNFVNIASKTSK